LVYPIWFRIGLKTRPEVPYKTTQKKEKSGIEGSFLIKNWTTLILIMA
jgi:hypothetical protein